MERLIEAKVKFTPVREIFSLENLFVGLLFGPYITGIRADSTTRSRYTLPLISASLK
jgi:hypothetical protein